MEVDEISFIDICAMTSLSIALYDDLRERKIRIIPVVFIMILGGVFQVFLMNEQWNIIIRGGIPGAISFMISKLSNECIGKGDCLLILCIGVLKGYSFCIHFVLISCIMIFLYSCYMMIRGRLHRKSQVPCVPFLTIGYIGAWLL